MNNGMSWKALMAAGALAVASVASASAPVQARDGRNTAAVLGAVGGFAAGAAIAGSQPRYYGQPSGYYAAPAYSGYYPVQERRIVVQEPECRVTVKRSYNRYGELRTKRRTVCD
jgi:hypothetical protein